MLSKLNETRFFYRIIIYILGLLVLSFGVAFSINARLGVSPVSTLPFVLSRIFYGSTAPHTSVGMLTTIMMAVFVLLQIAVKRKKFKWINLTQILFSFFFGFFVDFALFVFGGMQLPTYFGQLAMLAISIVLIAAGICLFMGARLVPLPTEGFCDAVATESKRLKFHTVKMIMDCVLVLIGIACAVSFLNGGGLQGLQDSTIREGTIISAIAIGKIIPYVRKALRPVLKLTENPKKA